MFVVSRISAENKRLVSQEKETEEELRELHRKSSEALARLARLRRLRESLVTRGAKMVNLGLKSLDELDEAERQETALESELVTEAISGSTADVVDWNLVFQPDLSLDDLLGSAGLGSSSEIPVPVVDSV